MTAPFIGLAALLTALLFGATYFGMPYRWFWTAQVVQYLLLAVVWVVAARAASPSGRKRASRAHVAAHRKASIVARLQQLAASAAATEIVVLARAIESLAEEVRSIPPHASGPDVSALLAEITRWTLDADTPALATCPVERKLALAQQAFALRSMVARRKRH